MFIPEDIIDNVRESNDIVDIISEYVALKKRGKNYVGLCPFHSEKTPSFTVNQDKQMYYCFGCGEGGNVISFIMRYRHMEFVEAVKMLAEKANISIPETGTGADNEEADLKKKLLEINREAARYFYINLRKSPKALDYFKGRGIDEVIIKKFGLGYSVDSFSGLMRYLAGKGYKEDLVEKAGLIIKREKSGYYDRFRNRVMFPVFDTRGKVIGFGGRVLDNSKPKYLNSPETPVFNKGYNLYGLNFAIKNNIDRKIIMVEGYMDVIALHQYGIVNAVASLGTALTLNQGKLLKRYSDEVIICYDSDTAGQAATLRGLEILTNAGLDVSILEIPKGKDPDEFIRAQGKDAFINCMNNTVPLIEYKIKRKSSQYDVSTTEGKIGFTKASAKELKEIDDPIVLDAYINKLSSEAGIAVTALYDEVRRQKNSAQDEHKGYDGHINGKSRYNNNIDGQKLYLESAYLKAEKLILYIIYEMKGYFKDIEKKLSWEDFNDNVYRKAAGIMYSKLSNGEDIVPADIISSFATSDDMKKISEIFSGGIELDKQKIDMMIDDYVNMINRHKLMSKKSLLKEKLKESDEKGELQQSAQLLKDIVEIERQLRML